MGASISTRSGPRTAAGSIFSCGRAGAKIFLAGGGWDRRRRRLTESPNCQTAVSVSPDGGRLMFTETAPKTSNDLMQMGLDGRDASRHSCSAVRRTERGRLA